MKTQCAKKVQGIFQVLFLVSLFTSPFFLSGCDEGDDIFSGGGNGSSIFDEYDKEDEKAENLATVLSTSGTTYKVVRMSYSQDYVVLQNMSTGGFVAYNYAKFDPATMKTSDDYMSAIGDGDIVTGLEKKTYTVDEYVTRYQTDYKTVTESELKEVEQYNYFCDCVETRWETVYYDKIVEVETPYTVLETNSYTYYENGNFKFENAEGAPKDLETIGGLMSQANSDQLASFVGSQYGLSSSRSSEIANLLVSFQDIKNTRGVTAEDLKALQSELLGTDLGTVLMAKAKAAQGDKKELTDLVDHAAQLNQVSPEQMQNILNQLIH